VELRELQKPSHIHVHIYIIHNFLSIYGDRVKPSPLVLLSSIGLQYQLRMTNGDSEAISGMNEWQGKPKYLEEIFPSAVPSTTDPT
jgi:hypothetical protein